MCIALCNYLCNKCRYKACYIELNSTDEIRLLNPMPKKDNTKNFTYMGVDFYPCQTMQTLPEIFKLNYDYIILDFGKLNTYTMNEYKRCNYRFAICPVSPWKRRNLCDFINMLKNNIKNYQKQITYIGYNEIKEIIKDASKSNSIDIIGLPFFQNPFQITSDKFYIYEKVLKRSNISR